MRPRARWSARGALLAAGLAAQACQAPPPVAVAGAPSAPAVAASPVLDATPPVAPSPVPDRALMRKFSPLPPLPPDPTNPVADDEAAARLGRRLFYDPGYARGGGVSCATCHQPERAFADGLGVAVALGTGSRNTPSLLHAARFRWQGWGGRGDSLWCQALAALENPIEMAGDRVAVARRFLAREGEAYRSLFGAPPATSAWPPAGQPGEPAYDDLSATERAEIDGVVARFGQALGAFMRRLEPGPSAFDRFVAGDEAALSPAAVRGFSVYAGKAKCAECHAGPLFSDGEFHNVGVMQSRGLNVDYGRAADLPRLLEDPFNGLGPHAAAAGALPVPGPDDDGRFRTPTLRNVTATAPYWHNGSFPTLGLALDFDLAGGGAFLPEKHYFPGRQDEKLKPVSLAASERADLAAFLESLAAGSVPAPWGERPE